jgi:tight adherence protein C
MLLLLGIGLFAGAVVFALDAAFKQAADRHASFRRVVSYATAQQATRAPIEHRPRLTETIVPLLSRMALRLTPKVQSDQLESRLQAAGVKRVNAQQFLALKSVAAIVGFFFAFALAGVTFGGIVFALLLVFSALLLPDMLLVRMLRQRAAKLTDHLPQAIDQIAISLEAGLGFDAAVSYFVRRSRSPLAAELRQLLTEIRMGESRTTALKNLSDRVPSEDMRNFVQTLVQSEGVGISRVSILRNQASALRQRRQVRAEERAQKAPVKMLFPIAIFILPVMFIVILGPAIQQASEIFGS